MSSSQSSITRKNISVHVVDNDSDHPIVHCLQLILIGKMRDFEMKVKAVTEGNEALDLIRKGASFDLVIMDMDMSTNGFEVCFFALILWSIIITIKEGKACVHVPERHFS